MAQQSNWGTLAVHGAEPRKKAFDAVTTPVVASATYAFENTAEIARYFQGDLEREEYGRYGNPTVRAAEAKLAAIGEQIRELAQLQCRLRRLVQVCERGNSDDCMTLHLGEMVSGITVEGAAP